MVKEENCTSYIKLNEFQNEIQNLEEEIEQKMQEWEDLNKQMDE